MRFLLLVDAKPVCAVYTFGFSGLSQVFSQQFSQASIQNHKKIQEALSKAQRSLQEHGF